MQDSSNYEVDTPNRLFRDVVMLGTILVIQVDTTQATASDRVKLWVNGVCKKQAFATCNLCHAQNA